MSFINNLSAHLFWDMDKTQIDEGKHRHLIVERVIARGTMVDLKLVNDFYSRNELKSILKKIEYISPKDLRFVSVIYDIPETEIEWYKKTQSNRNYFYS